MLAYQGIYKYIVSILGHYATMHCSVASSQQKEASNTASHLYVGKLLEHNTITGANLCTTQPRPCSCFPDQATVRPVTSSHSVEKSFGIKS